MAVKGLEECACECAVDFDGFVVECNDDAVSVEDEGCYGAVSKLDAVYELDACGVWGFSWLCVVVRGVVVVLSGGTQNCIAW